MTSSKITLNDDIDNLKKELQELLIIRDNDKVMSNELVTCNEKYIIDIDNLKNSQSDLKSELSNLESDKAKIKDMNDIVNNKVSYIISVHIIS